MSKVIDANVIVRFLVAESPALVAKIKNYLNSQEKIVFTDVTLAEIIWILTSYYKFEKKDILEKIQFLLEVENFVINRPVIVKALFYYQQFNIDYIDAYLAAYTEENGMKELISFDKSLDKITAIKRVEP